MSHKEYRLLVIGAGGVGKSALTISFFQNVFITEYDPTIEDSFRKVVVIDEETCLLNVLDTAGEEVYAPLRDAYVVAAHGYVMAYAINDRRSFDYLGQYILDVRRAKDSDKVSLVIVGTKSDLVQERKVSQEDAHELADFLEVPCIETSAKERINVEEAFYECVRTIERHSNGLVSYRAAKSKKCSLM